MKIVSQTYPCLFFEWLHEMVDKCWMFNVGGEARNNWKVCLPTVCSRRNSSLKQATAGQLPLSFTFYILNLENSVGKHEE